MVKPSGGMDGPPRPAWARAMTRPPTYILIRGSTPRKGTDAAAPTSVWLTTRQFLVPVASPFGFLVVVVACCCLFGLISDPGVPPDATHRSLPRLDSRLAGWVGWILKNFLAKAGDVGKAVYSIDRFDKVCLVPVLLLPPRSAIVPLSRLSRGC